jgi:hypothetical protein
MSKRGNAEVLRYKEEKSVGGSIAPERHQVSVAPRGYSARNRIDDT